MAGLVQRRRNDILLLAEKGHENISILFHDTTEYFHGLSLNLIDATRNVSVFS